MGLFKKKTPVDDVVDLREPAPAAAFEPQPGAPTPCPDCGAPGYVDHIDLKSRVQREHCKGCGTEWEWEWSDTEPVETFDHGIEIPGRR